jgi:ketosteroid isomerase-like protein
VTRKSCALALLINLVFVAVTVQARPADAEEEVRKAFTTWSTALTRGDKKSYLDAFWNSPRLVIRVANGEWRGIDAYRARIEGAQLPPGNPSDYRKVEVVIVSADAAIVTYERPAPQQANTSAGEAQIFRGTLLFTLTPGGWKIAAWHAHSLPAAAATTTGH